jgi:acetylornithine deacetylase/succinyl-diaminopimelate desuccinylase-like protein
MPTAGLPVVYGERTAGPDANTILIYGHYDVQPPEPYEAWISPPFEPTVRDGRIYARGAGDNKGQFLAHILAIKVLADLGKLPRLNIKLLLEGEEESSSPNYLFTNVLKMPAIWATYGPHDQNNHSPNENITVKSFFDGIRASALVLQRFAAMPRSDVGRGPQNTVT